MTDIADLVVDPTDQSEDPCPSFPALYAQLKKYVTQVMRNSFHIPSRNARSSSPAAMKPFSTALNNCQMSC